MTVKDLDKLLEQLNNNEISMFDYMDAIINDLEDDITDHNEHGLLDT